MTTPLQQVLEALEQARGPVSVAQISRALEIEPSALQGMIDFWVRKGRLRVSGDPGCSSGCAVCAPDGTPQSCPALLVIPRRFEVVHPRE